MKRYALISFALNLGQAPNLE
ncbi:unknown protein [Parachlamydia acanthamoebae UV-7]|uniref:Uncharacterized protein n=1 Tax=Parachlamydia acanthamoebae (strain UV7) TaxID=765952 RepID=F8KYS9_PARAV|nr:unknown protein [Parachlamydia acanthamoebae UV-7]